MRNLLKTVKGIPTGEYTYNRLEYIENTGTQYIVSNTNAGNITKVELDAQVTETATTQWLFGRYVANNALSVELAGSSKKICCDIKSSSNRLTFSGDATDRYKMVVDVDNKTFTVGETVLGPAGDVGQMPSGSYALVGGYYNGFLGCRAKYYSVKVWENGVLVYDLIPAKRNDGVVGMLNKVDGTFLLNSGTGSFSEGPINSLAVMIPQNITIGEYISAQGSEMESPYNFFYNKYIEVEPNTQYTLSWDDQLYFASISEYTNSKGFVKRTGVTLSEGQRSLSITTGSTTKFLRWGSNMYRTTTLTLDIIQNVDFLLI